MVASDTSIWRFGAHSITCDHPVLMGIVNVTPDSFSDGGKFTGITSALDHARTLVSDGADILDIGGESTRPGSESVSVDEEIRRVVPVIEAIRKDGIITPISIDTRKRDVAKAAVDAGAEIINDVSALRDEPAIADLIASNNLGVVLMHMLGMPKTMQVAPHYTDVIDDIGKFFEERIAFAESRSIKPEQLVLDPGIGFGKTLEHNLRILRECGSWSNLGRPLVIGPSRKRFIGDILNVEVDKRLYGTIGACVSAYYCGARIFRVHDVGPVRDALQVVHAIINGK